MYDVERADMEKYKNLSGTSGIVAFELMPDGIKVQFSEGAVYLYTNATPGRVHVEHMRKTAGEGRGLATYISRHVKNNYARRLK